MLDQARGALGHIRTRFPWSSAALLFAILLVLPYVGLFDETWVRVFFFIALFAMLGLGLNVVVGFAGLLDLGYVAFFAAGAYTLAIMTSPSSALDAQWNFWLVIPLAIAVGAAVGVLLGLPVLPLRGDYLAIVTLGFGEIIRFLLVNLDEYTEGSQGISAIGKPSLVFTEIDSPNAWYHFIVVCAFVVAFFTTRLRDSRLGRAWEAIREDEDVAAAMGIDTVRYKLMAFAVGAAIGALGGVMYASFFGFVNPQAFTLEVSVNVLALVIIGGMGSTPGVIVGAFILIGVPRILQLNDTASFLSNFEWLRKSLNGMIDGVDALVPWGLGELPPASTWGDALADDTRFIIYGALLVAIMVLRPSGIFPSRRRRIEFEESVEPRVAEGSAA